MKLNNNKIELNEKLNLANTLNKCNKDYEYFVCDIYDGLNIISGWEYKEDAKDALMDEEEICEDNFFNCELKIYTRKYLNNLK